MAIAPVIITGRVVADAETRFQKNGSAVTNFRIVESDKRKNKQTDEWEDSRTLWLTVDIWDENPEFRNNPVQWGQIASSITKGQMVAVKGKLYTDEWEKDGQRRSQIKFLAESFYVMPDTRSAQGQGQGAATFNPIQAQNTGNGWGQQQPQGNDPWGSQPAAPGGFDNAENPPF